MATAGWSIWDSISILEREYLGNGWSSSLSSRGVSLDGIGVFIELDQGRPNKSCIICSTGLNIFWRSPNLFLCGRMEFVSEWIYGDLSDWTSLDKVRFNRLIIPSDHNGHQVSRHLDRRVVDVQQPAFLWWIFRGEGDGLRRDAGDLIFFNSPSWAACWTNFCSQGFDPHTWWILPGTKFFHNWDQTSSIWFCDGSIIFYPQMINLGSGSLSWQAHQSRERRS